MAIQEVRIADKDRDIAGEVVFGEIQRAIGVSGLDEVRTARVYSFEGVDEAGVQTLTEQLLCEQIDQEATLNEPIITDAQHVIHVAYKPGVMNPEIAPIMKAAHALDVHLDAAASGTEYGFYGEVTKEDVAAITQRLLVNKITQHIVVEKPETLRITGEVGPTAIVPIR